MRKSARRWREIHGGIPALWSRAKPLLQGGRGRAFLLALNWKRAHVPREDARRRSAEMERGDGEGIPSGIAHGFPALV